jgi:DNA polymerase III subunit beta
MKILCTQENFKRALLNTEKAVSRQNTLPILNNILFEVDKSGLKLSATNLEIGVQSKIGGKIEKEGKITIPARLLSNFINNMPIGDNIMIESIERGVRIKSSSVRADIKGIAASDFPLIPQKKTDFLLSLKNSALRDILTRVMVSVARNDARTELTGINITLKPRDLYFASTDSFRLAEYILHLEKETFVNEENWKRFIEKNENIIIPQSTIAEVIRIIQSDSGEEIKIAIEEGQIFFEVSGTVVVSRLINGKYPEYRHIMPQNYKTRIVGDKNAILAAVRMASVFSSGKSNEVSLKINSGHKKILIEARSVETGENLTELKFDVTGPDQEVVFNAKYLLDGINSISSGQIAWLFNSGETPAAMREINESSGEVMENYTYIVMPIKN